MLLAKFASSILLSDILALHEICERTRIVDSHHSGRNGKAAVEAAALSRLESFAFSSNGGNRRMLGDEVCRCAYAHRRKFSKRHDRVTACMHKENPANAG
jgi:hypothetical protein